MAEKQPHTPEQIGQALEQILSCAPPIPPGGADSEKFVIVASDDPVPPEKAKGPPAGILPNRQGVQAVVVWSGMWERAIFDELTEVAVRRRNRILLVLTSDEKHDAWCAYAHGRPILELHPDPTRKAWRPPERLKREPGDMEPRLSSFAVTKLMQACLAATCEPEDDAIKVEGIVHGYAFDRGRIEMAGATIGNLLAELPLEFQLGHGGGWSFLNASTDRHGTQWTGLHLEMEWLFALGIASGRARWMMARDMWDVFPGGMPYVMVSRDPIPNADARDNAPSPELG